MATAAPAQNQLTHRHAALVRVTHWITVVCFVALLVTGAEIVVSHPRFYWGETGNSGTPVLFKIPIPSSRATVPSGYNYVMPDQNGWSRYLHFEAAWALVLTGLLYALWGLRTGHFRSNLFPAPGDRTPNAFLKIILGHLRFKRPSASEALTYNALQRVSYLGVIFLLFPLVILTGLALSPGFNAAFPIVVDTFGGRQSARTLHFFISIALLGFLFIHVAMIILAGFRSRLRPMITGTVKLPQERV